MRYLFDFIRKKLKSQCENQKLSDEDFLPTQPVDKYMTAQTKKRDIKSASP